MKPDFIHSKSKIYLIAPSFGCTTTPYKERLERAIQHLKLLGHTVIIGPNCFLNKGKCASNTPKKRAQEFMEAYRSDADCIISVGGGEMMYEILDYINFDEIKKLPPKWFVGFSDNTNLTFTLTTLCDLETIYGCNAPHFHLPKFTYDSLATYQMLQGRKKFSGYTKYEYDSGRDDQTDPFGDYRLNQKKVITSYLYTQPFSGTLIGGNLDIMQYLCGTPYDHVKEYTMKHTEGIIFYLEACDLNVLAIKRTLLQLKRADWFHNIKGFLVGRPLCIQQEFMNINHINAVIDILKSYKVPILLDIDLGHIAPSLPMRNGAYVTIQYEKENIYFSYK